MSKLIKLVSDGNLKPSSSDFTAMVLKVWSLDQQQLLELIRALLNQNLWGVRGSHVLASPWGDANEH